ncbi:hypothetical protein ABHA37_08115 [Clostridium tertium]|uniref:hypothetical protein n=1 Tax=Clostridium tertium TaxID=1559 RepID=UPI002331297C|nr:hypothetical protein [Clostridium tertium]MDB1923377.1 hypothetical protein [Clostridium tertium]MDB1929982.1 hypothetical protein [Clostridium tertium]
MSKEKINIDETISKAVKVAIKEYDKEKKIESKKNVFHNTKLLMKHYNDLKSHVDNAISDVTQLEEDKLELGEMYEEDELYIASIKKSKAKSLIMIAHIDTAMETLYNQHKRKGTLEKYLALESYFVQEKTYEEIAENLNCGVNTPRRWINELLNELGVYLFGVECIKLD